MTKFYIKTGILPALLCLALGWPLHAAAWEETDDHLELSVNKALVPDGSTYATVTVKMVGSRIYTAYNMDIHLPEGVELTYKSNGDPYVTVARDIWPYTLEDEDDEDSQKIYTHNFGCTYGVVGERWLRVACISLKNEDFTAQSGRLFTFRVKATPYCKPGDLEITIDGINFTATDRVEAWKYVPTPETHTISVSDQSTVSVNISAANKYSTLVLPFAAALPDGVQAYSCRSVEGDNLVLEEASSLAAYTPYVLYAEDGYSGTLSGTVDAAGYSDVVSDGYLRGAIAAQQVSEGYVLQNQGSGVRFYNTNGQNFAVPAGRCWLIDDGSSLSPSFGWGDPTAVRSAASTAADSPIYYNINGTRAQEPQLGNIYIHRGKKILKLK